MKSKFLAMKSVYSYFFPEVRELVHFGEKFPNELYLTQTSTKSLRAWVADRFKPELKLTQNPNGTINLDDIHEPVIDRVVKAYKNIVPALKDFCYRYPTAGSSEGIFHILAYLKAKGFGHIFTLKGEYEGYKEYAETLGIKTIEMSYTDLQNAPIGGVIFISNPSAVDGNIIPSGYINDLCEKHKVVLDLAYAGLTCPYKFDISNPNIIAVVMSMSKPYGVFRFRMGGFTFSHFEVKSLYANKWFKDVPRLLTALKIIETIPPGSLYEKYQPIQSKIIDELRRDFNIPINPSDVLLLGWMGGYELKELTKSQKTWLSEYRRGDGYRFCLTPYFERYENE